MVWALSNISEDIQDRVRQYLVGKDIDDQRIIEISNFLDKILKPSKHMYNVVTGDFTKDNEKEFAFGQLIALHKSVNTFNINLSGCKDYLILRNEIIDEGLPFYQKKLIETYEKGKIDGTVDFIKSKEKLKIFKDGLEILGKNMEKEIEEKITKLEHLLDPTKGLIKIKQETPNIFS